MSSRCSISMTSTDKSFSLNPNIPLDKVLIQKRQGVSYTNTKDLSPMSRVGARALYEEYNDNLRNTDGQFEEGEKRMVLRALRERQWELEKELKTVK